MRAAVEAAEREDAARKDAAKIAAENGPGARLDPHVALTSSEPPRCSVVAASVEELRASLEARGGTLPRVRTKKASRPDPAPPPPKSSDGTEGSDGTGFGTTRVGGDERAGSDETWRPEKTWPPLPPTTPEDEDDGRREKNFIHPGDSNPKPEDPGRGAATIGRGRGEEGAENGAEGDVVFRMALDSVDRT